MRGGTITHYSSKVTDFEWRAGTYILRMWVVGEEEALVPGDSRSVHQQQSHSVVHNFSKSLGACSRPRHQEREPLCCQEASWDRSWSAWQRLGEEGRGEGEVRD